MTVEERRVSNSRDGSGVSGDKFPVGLRVLAVDDDRACLKLLEALLRRCQYHVTATNQAIIALKLLRENKDKFDLVISDVHMPDMDGFKLLELVGLEMDLPVIMLSANGDPKAVMKGITHGACDYLLKPVRLEELKNIWQHVVRRKKFDSKDTSNYDHADDSDKPNQVNSEEGHVSVATGSFDHNGRASRKRKDQNDEDDDDCEEDGNDNEDPSMQKKPRVVWSVELHRKFVAAVNQLGIDKAMPKRILDLMNVEKLTRENVASHLQKYRLYLKRISTVASQQANFVAALGGKDPPYVQMGSLDGVRNFQAFAGSGHLSNLASFQQGGVGRLNSPTGSGLYNLASSGMIHLGQAHNISSNLTHDLGKLQNISFSGTTQTSLLNGIPASSELSQLQQHKTMLESRNALSRRSSDARFHADNSNNLFVNPTNNNQILQAPLQQKAFDGFSSMSSSRVTSLSTDPFEMCGVASPYLPDFRKGDDTLPGTSPLAGYATNPLHLRMPFSNENPLTNSMRESVSPMSSNVDGNLYAVSSSNAVVTSLPDVMMGRDFQCQASSPGVNALTVPTVTNENMVFPEVASIGISNQRWEGLNHDQIQRTSLTYNSSWKSVLPNNNLMNTVSRNTGFDNGISNNSLDVSMNQTSFNPPIYTENCDFGRSSSNSQLKSREDYPLDPTKLEELGNSNGYHPFDDLMGAIIKQEREDMLMDGDIGCDIYSLETCM